VKVALVLVLQLVQARGGHGRMWYPGCLEFVEAYSCTLGIGTFADSSSPRPTFGW
jgi:hypothetical protein